MRFLNRLRILNLNKYYLALIFFVGGACAGIFKLHNLSVIFLILSYVYLYAAINRRPYFLWLANPLRFLLPTFLLFQIIFWLRCVLISNDVVSLPRILYGEFYNDLGIISMACSKYLMEYFVYFFSICVGFNISNKPANRQAYSYPLYFQHGTILIIAIPAVLFVSIYFLNTYEKMVDIPVIISYFATTIARFSNLFWMLLTLVIIFSNRPVEKLVSTGTHISNIIINIFTIFTVKMRFLLVEQLLSVLYITFTFFRPRLKNLPVYVVTITTVAILLLTTTHIKEYGEIYLSDMYNEIPILIDRIIIRTSSFHADIIIEQSAYLRSLISGEKSLILREFLGGLPFSRIFFLDYSEDEIPFDMQFYWAISQTYQKVSFFVSGFTVFRYSYGLIFAYILAIVFGLIHGYLSARVISIKMPYSWIIPQAVFLPVAIHGIRKQDFLEIILNLLLFYLVLHFLTKKY